MNKLELDIEKAKAHLLELEAELKKKKAAGNSLTRKEINEYKSLIGGRLIMVPIRISIGNDIVLKDVVKVRIWWKEGVNSQIGLESFHQHYDLVQKCNLVKDALKSMDKEIKVFVDTFEKKWGNDYWDVIARAR